MSYYIRAKQAGLNIDKLKTHTMMVCGLGVLGANLIPALAAAGLNFILIDRDVYEIHNIQGSPCIASKGFKNVIGKPKVSVMEEIIKNINPECKVFKIYGDLTLDVGLGWFKETSIVCSAVDNIAARIWIDTQSKKFNKVWINGGLNNNCGSVEMYQPGGTSCYTCNLSEKDLNNKSRSYSCSGLKRNIPQKTIPLLPLTTQVTAGIYGEALISFLTDGICLTHKLIYLAPLQKINRIVMRNPDFKCGSHSLISRYDKDIERVEIYIDNTLKEVKNILGKGNIQLRNSLVISMVCNICGKKIELLKRKKELYENETLCCNTLMELEEIYSLPTTGPIYNKFKHKKLREFGIPEKEIIHFISKEKERVILIE